MLREVTLRATSHCHWEAGGLRYMNYIVYFFGVLK